ncbi:hypothetical protein [Leptospira santarosai]|uniref:CRISPR-associated RAMP protein n=1 Tax=Leptospira santarosai str. ZUN179 TaxID=1049985 RepID=M6ULV9_9LEPT|nr:hypothetical protein [Leptospira santarosai]EMO43801.1 hypothetical protein LEP1GSC187_0505 [Leptospira santarosai str. ZUN179]
MNTTQTYHVFCLSETLSPLSHMMGTSGNEALLNRESVRTENGIKLIPVISGNAIRHRIIRDAGSYHLINLYELAGKLNIDQMNFMLSGGSLTESSVTDNMKTIADMQRLFPLYRLLGGSLKNQIITGAMHVSRGVLVCEENRETLNKILPEELSALSKTLMGAESFVSSYQYTRGDISKINGVDIILASDELTQKRDSTLMLYGGQNIITNSFFVHEFTLTNVSQNELGALLNAINYWQKSNGIIGGNSRIGHGRLKTYVYIPGEQSVQTYIDEYEKYAISVKEEAINWLNTAFAKKEKAKK